VQVQFDYARLIQLRAENAERLRRLQRQSWIDELHVVEDIHVKSASVRAFLVVNHRKDLVSAEGIESALQRQFNNIQATDDAESPWKAIEVHVK